MAKRIDLTGYQLDTVTIIKPSEYNKGYWIGKCSRCGNISEYRAYEITHDISKHCKICGDPRIERLEGKQFGEWTVLKYAGSRQWLCKCSCGEVRTVQSAMLRSGRSLSCGHNKIANIQGNESVEVISNSYKSYVGKTIYNWQILEHIDGKYFKCKCLKCNKTYNRDIASIIRGQSTQCKSCGALSNDDIIGSKINSWTVLKRDPNNLNNYICRSITRYTLINGLSKCCGMCNKTDSQVEIFNNKELLMRLIDELTNELGRKPTSYEVANKLSINYNSLNRKIAYDNDIKDLIDHNRSEIEDAIINIVKQYCNNYKLHDRTVLDGKELDIYIPDKKLAIEVNGSYWHSDNFKDSNYHQLKTLSCIKNGIKLIHIFDYEWWKNSDKLTNYIIEQLSNNKTIINGRDTSILEIDGTKANEFMEKYHLQGKCNSTINIALAYNGDIVSIMSFSKPRFNNEFQYEIIRLAFKNNTIINGGVEKLFSYFIRQYKPKSIVSYSNLSKFYGTVYTKLGFSGPDITKPNYMWVKPSNKSTLTRYQTMKHKLIEQGLGTEEETEDEIMENLGYYKVYDCGNYKYEYRT